MHSVARPRREPGVVIHVRVVSPAASTPAVLDVLVSDDGVVNLTRLSRPATRPDGDGIQFTDVQLYADAGYRTGYARVKFTDGTKSIYTKVSCQILIRK